MNVRDIIKPIVQWSLVATICLIVQNVMALPSYEPFSQPPGTNLVNPGSPTGLANTWYAISTGSGGTQPLVETGSLSTPNLAQSLCHHVKFGGLGTGARFNLVATGGTMTSGTVMFSFLLRVTDLTGLDTAGGYFVGFNNSLNGQANQPTVTAPRVLLRTVVTDGVTNGFNVGMTKSSNLSQDMAWDARVFTTSDTIFIVGRYQFNAGDAFNDLGIVWVNPDPASFGNLLEPQTGMNTTAGQDLGGLASFLLLERGAEPAAMSIDELRFGTTWSEVTTPYASFPAPTPRIVPSGTNFIVSWPTNYLCFALETTSSLSNSTTWTPAAAPVVVVGDQNNVTNATSGSNQFFRLRSP